MIFSFYLCFVAATQLPFPSNNYPSKSLKQNLPVKKQFLNHQFHYRMPSVGVKDVDQQKFTVALAAFLKK